MIPRTLVRLGTTRRDIRRRGLFVLGARLFIRPPTPILGMQGAPLQNNHHDAWAYPSQDRHDHMSHSRFLLLTMPYFCALAMDIGYHLTHDAICEQGHHTVVILITPEEDRVYEMAFSPDGTTLASASSGRTIRLWIARTEILLDLVCDKVWRNLTLNAWRRFVGRDIPYERTCNSLPPGAGVEAKTTR